MLKFEIVKYGACSIYYCKYMNVTEIELCVCENSIVMSLYEFKRLLDFFTFARANRTQFKLMTNIFDNCLLEVKSAQFEGLDFMDSHEDTYTIHNGHCSMELCQDILSYCYDKIMNVRGLTFEDGIYKIWKGLAVKKSNTLVELCNSVVLENILKGCVSIEKGLKLLPLPTILKDVMHEQYMHVRAGAQTIPPLTDKRGRN